MIDADQMKAARALLGMTQDELAKATGLSAQTIKRMESLGTEKSAAGNVLAIQRALETAGVTFIPENGGGAGVRLSKPRSKDAV